MLKIDGVTHWSIPVNDLEESESPYARRVAAQLPRRDVYMAPATRSPFGRPLRHRR